MVDDKKQALKKFAYDYAIALGTTIALLVILAILILARQLSLASVKDVSKINPLITSEQNELVAVNGSSDVVKIAKDDESQTVQSGTTKDVVKSTSPAPGTGSTNGSSGGGSTSGASTGSSGTSSSPSPSPSPVSQSFTAVIGQLTYNSSTSCLLVICSTTYTVQAVIQGQNGPGKVNYQWIEDNSVAQSSTVSFAHGDSSKTISYQPSVGKGHTVTLQLTSPNEDKKSVSLQ